MRDARLYADERPGGEDAFIGDPDLIRLINLALAEEYDLLVRAGGHERYATIDTSLTTTAGTATIPMPTDFMELLSVHLNWGPRALEQVDALESIADRRDLMNLGVWSRDSAKAFR